MEEGDVPMDAIVRASGLVKKFGEVRALNGLDLEVSRGEVMGFLGPNGAGKSTTIRALLGQIRLDGGSARLFGLDAWRDAVRIHERLAYVPGDVALWPGLTGGECIDLLSSLQGRPNARRRAELIERFDFVPTKKTRTYSKGNRQKVGLIAALSTDAELLLLDEPTSGLDPLMEAQFQAVVRERVDEGATVLLSSHILSEAQTLCHRISIIRAGRVVRSGSLSDLRAESSSTIQCTTPEPVRALADLPGVTITAEEREDCRVWTVARVSPNDLVAAVETVTAAQPLALTVEPPSLDELFLDYYRRDDAVDGQSTVVSGTIQ